MELACSRDGGGVPILVQIEFKVCTGVHSGPKGPVIDITSSFCGWAPGPLGNVFNANKILRFALGYVLGRRALSLICRSLASNPCPSKI